MKLFKRILFIFMAALVFCACSAASEEKQPEAVPEEQSVEKAEEKSDTLPEKLPEELTEEAPEKASEGASAEMQEQSPAEAAVELPEDRIAEGFYGDCPWIVDSSGCLYLGDGKGEYTLPEAEFIYRPAHIYDIRRSPWYDYNDQILSVKVLPGVRTGENGGSLFANLYNAETIDLTALDTSDMDFTKCMFYNCKSLSSVDLSGMDTSNVTNMIGMFAYCSSLTELDLSGFDTSKVITFSNMFEGCGSLKGLNLSSFNTASATQMSCMFIGCESLSYLDVSSFDTSNVTGMWDMFSGCRSLELIDLSSFDFSGIGDAEYALGGCVSEVLLPDGTKWIPRETSEDSSMEDVSQGGTDSAEQEEGSIAEEEQQDDQDSAEQEEGSITEERQQDEGQEDDQDYSGDMSPVISIQYVPEYGKDDFLKGTVFMENGSSFNPSDYRVALYLQITEGGKYWVKPFYDYPYVDIKSDGSFSVEYATGGEDTQAAVMHVMIVPGDFLPDPSFSRTYEAALDYVRIDREPNGYISINPER